MISHTLKSFIFLFLVLSTIQGCTKLVCEEVSGGSPLLAIELFPEHLDRYVFTSPVETVELVRKELNIEPTDKARYMGSCGGGFTLKNCSCSSQHFEEYSNDNFSFEFYASNTQVGDEPPMNLIMIEAREGNGDNQINVHISFEQRNLKSELNKILVSEIILNGVTYNEVYKFTNYYKYSNYEEMIVLIKPHEGMVAFYVENVLYELE